MLHLEELEPRVLCSGLYDDPTRTVCGPTPHGGGPLGPAQTKVDDPTRTIVDDPTRTVTQNDTGPVISNFTATEGAMNVWVFSGTVTDSNGVAGLTVKFGGLETLVGQTATVGKDGNFSLIIALQQGEGGYATAQTTDSQGLVSNLAQALVDTTPLDHGHNT